DLGLDICAARGITAGGADRALLSRIHLVSSVVADAWSKIVGDRIARFVVGTTRRIFVGTLHREWSSRATLACRRGNALASIANASVLQLEKLLGASEACNLHARDRQRQSLSR